MKVFFLKLSTHNMRALSLIILFILIQLTAVTASTGSVNSFPGDSTSIVINQPDSVTRKLVYLLLEAHQQSNKKPLLALSNYRKALAINKAKDIVWEADIQLAMGRLLYRVKSADAIPQLLKADALYKRKSNVAGRSEALTEIARIKEASGLTAEALKSYNELYTIQNKGGESVLAGNTATYLTDIFLKKKNYPEALKYADLARKAYYNFCRKDSLGSIFYRIAYIKRKQSAPKQAEHYILNEALSYYRSADDLQGRLKCFDFLGSLYLEQKRYSEAKWFYLQANNQSRIIDDTPSIISSLINLGITKILIGDLVLAKQDIAEAEALVQADSVYAPIIKKAKIKYATLFKKLDAPVIASPASKKATISALKPKSPAIKKTKPVAAINTDADKKAAE